MYDFYQEDETESKGTQLKSISEEGSGDVVDGPDTSSFTAFLYSLLSSTESGENPNSDEQGDEKLEQGNPTSNSVMKENGGRRSLFSKGKQTLGRVVYQAARISGYRNHERKGDLDLKIDGDNDANFDGVEIRHVQKIGEPNSLSDIPDVSEPSLLLSENTRTALHASLPPLVQGRKWLLIYRSEERSFYFGNSILSLRSSNITELVHGFGPFGASALIFIYCPV